jgi:hypothetical protein
MGTIEFRRRTKSEQPTVPTQVDSVHGGFPDTGYSGSENVQVSPINILQESLCLIESEDARSLSTFKILSSRASERLNESSRERTKWAKDGIVQMRNRK